MMLLSFVLPKEAEGKKSFIPDYIYKEAIVFKINPTLLYSICKVESNCNPKAINHNDGTKKQKQAGIVVKSHGLFQIKLDTAKILGFKGTAKELQIPTVNAHYAAKYLNKLYIRYNDTNKVISAYNAGSYTPKNNEYVLKVLKNYITYSVDRRF